MSTELPGRTTANEQLVLNRADLKRLGIRVSNSSLLRWEHAGRFPLRLRMAGTSVAWLKSEVDAWLSDRATERVNHHYADPY
ncbi:MAG: AlpA family phage regulatory protein [Rhizobiales bacterium]|nr:AlpA family phage regulatory protein [Hyphomicrobiales bacterium]MBO6700345.1 AlpA family phage regulatory protein [Hyphomicrobiales bacterium]MBO6737490.1 AlpA family phage regulatory protein [Hyphomicrobiales bacterium]MBO6913453.1 AlpA family phage regulatory protein [Hyphomicrobiales bacterium]MBO6955384.1 AlpA family phage regulatory protein [Hyphomicrobiales bacterium]